MQKFPVKSMSVLASLGFTVLVACNNSSNAPSEQTRVQAPTSNPQRYIPMARSSCPDLSTAETTTHHVIANLDPYVEGAGQLLLPDCRVIRMGGSLAVPMDYPSSDDWVANVNVYDRESNSWQALAPIPIALSDFSAMLLDKDNIFIVGGRMWGATANGSIPSRAAFIYNIKNNAWKRLADSGADHWRHQSVLLNDGRALVTGGGGYYSQPLMEKFSEIYDPVSNTWSGKQTLGASNGYDKAAYLLSDGRVLVPYEDQSGAYNLSAKIYDPRTNSWNGTTFNQSYPNDSLNIGAITTQLADGSVGLVWFGAQSDPGTSTVIVYKFKTGTTSWDPLPKMTMPGENHFPDLDDAVLTSRDNGHLYYWGGYGNLEGWASVDIDLNSNKSTALQSYPQVGSNRSTPPYMAIQVSIGEVMVFGQGASEIIPLPKLSD